MKPLTLCVLFILLGLCVYGFFNMKGTVQVFVIMAAIVIGLLVWFCAYVSD